MSFVAIQRTRSARCCHSLSPCRSPQNNHSTDEPDGSRHPRRGEWRAVVFGLLFSSLPLFFPVHSTAALLAPQADHPPNTAQNAPAPVAERDEDDGWIPLFNGKDLTGWIPKIRGCPLGENWGRTFRVEDGLLKVRYDQYDSFGDRFGHLFYKDTFSHYILRIEYRFVGDQVPGGPGWAFRNSGVMIHGQDPKTMDLDQKFPVSIEAQLLGGDGSTPRPTLNLCTPGTNVVINGKLVTRHCTNSSSRTYHGDQWVVAEIEVHGDRVIRHKIDGKVVLEYEQPQLDPKDPEARKLIQDDRLLLNCGTISLQSESHPCDFRRVEIKVLDE